LEAEIAQDGETARVLAAGKLVGLKNTAADTPGGKAKDRLGWIVFAVVDKIVAEGVAKPMVNLAAVEVGKRLEHVVAGDAVGDASVVCLRLLRHGWRPG
jgi:hypothetical protein